jgi:hypothetical protein
MILSAVREERPDNPRMLVRHRDGSPVLAASGDEGSQPLTPVITLRIDPAPHSSRAVPEEFTPIAIPACTHPEEPWRAARRVFQRDQAQPGRQPAAVLEVEGGGSGRPCAGYPRATTPSSGGRQDVVPPASHRMPVRSTGHQHGSAKQRRGGHVGDPARCGTPSAPRPEPSAGTLPPTDAPAGTTHAAIQIPRARPTLSRRVQSYRLTLLSSTPPTTRFRVPSKNGSKIPDLVGDHGHSDGCIKANRGAAFTALCLVMASA